MKVLLIKEVQGLGHQGDIKDVSTGYAMNFLLPQKLAEVIDRHANLMLEAQKRKKERVKKEARKDKTKMGTKLNGKNFTILVRADDKGTLYAGLDKKSIVDFFTGKGFNVIETEIILEEPIKKIGDYNIKLKLGDKESTVILTVKKGL